MPVFYLNFNMILGFIAAISLFTSCSLQNPASARSITFESIPLAPVTGPITAQFISEASGLDGPKLSAVNSTSYDWWYFDVASPDLQSSVIVTFFTAGGSAITNAFGTTVPWAFLVGTFPNGTAFQYYLPSTSPAVVITDDDGSSGSWSGTGLGWSGTSDLTQYTILIDIPALNVNGSVVLNSLAPAHYPCGPEAAGSDLEITLNIGWANAVPDAVGHVDIQIEDTLLKFQGVGYHDKNWGNKIFADSFESWYWGHAHVGDYGIVWFEVIDNAGEENVSAYASLNGEIVAATCVPKSAVVRPVGTSYPPSLNGEWPTGFTIELNLGSAGTLSVTATATNTVFLAATYRRWIGTVSGSLALGSQTTQLSGIGLWEEIA